MLLVKYQNVEIAMNKDYVHRFRGTSGEGVYTTRFFSILSQDNLSF